VSVGPMVEAPGLLSTDTLTVGDLFAQRFPSVDLVAAAAGLLRATNAGGSAFGVRAWDGSEVTRRFFVEVTGGTVKVRATDPARAERRGNDGLGAFDAYAAKRRAQGRTVIRDDRDPSLHDLDGYGQWLGVDDPGIGERSAHREVTEWSRRSRSRMVERLAQLDYAPMLRRGTPAMVTLTYPGEWLSVAPNGKAVKRHLVNFWKRWERRWGVPFDGPWKLEFQGRGAPHLHLWCVPPVEPRIVGRGILLADKDFASWLSSTWADVVDHQDPVHRMRHERAGTGVDYAEGTRYADPRRLARYFSGHSLKHADGKEYQHVVPESWRTPGDGPGRWWGYRGLSVVRSTVELDLRAFLTVRRTLRRLTASQRYCRAEVVDRVDTRTGVVRRRRVTRRAGERFTSPGLVGGWLLCNDAPSVVAALSRLPALAVSVPPNDVAVRLTRARC
jgi:hypothetical protein